MATKKQVFIPFTLLIGAIAIATGLYLLKEPPQEKIKEAYVPIVKVMTIESQTIALDVNSQGTVTPKESTTLVAQVTGKITKLSNSFNRGDIVKAGEVLAWIDESDYQTQLIEAQANLASARASLQQEKAQGHVAEREWQQITNASPSELGLRKPQLAQEVAKVRAATAGVSRAKRNLERTQIVAPYDAIIDNKNIGLGSFVSMGSVIGELSRIDVAQVRLPVSDRELKFLENQGVNATVTLTASFNGQLTQWEGKIIRNEGIIDTKTRMNYLVAEIKRPYELDTPLHFGHYVSAQISGKVVDDTAIIPSYVIEERGVALMTQEGTLHFEPVNIIRQQGDNTIILWPSNQHNQLIISALDVSVAGMAIKLFKPKSGINTGDKIDGITLDNGGKQ